MRIQPGRQSTICIVLGLAIVFLLACSLTNEVELTPTGNVAETNPAPTPSPPETQTPEPTLTPTYTDTPRPTLTASPTPTPFITAPPRGEAVNLPILMYHHLDYLDANAGVGLRTWTVSPSEFAKQLDYIRMNGFHTISFGQLVGFFQEGLPLPDRPIILTFDDGWMAQYTVAFQELKKRGMIGTFFAPTSYLDAGGKSLFDWDQAREMSRAGMEFGSHTIKHLDLTTVYLDEVRRQLQLSKQAMEEQLGVPIVALSYPFGMFNPKVVAATEAAGYRAAVILCCGYKQTADAMLMMPRIRISYDDSLQDVAKRLPLH